MHSSESLKGQPYRNWPYFDACALYQMEQKPKVHACKTWEMNQATRRKKAIPQPIAETALERLRQEMAMSPIARSAQEGLKVFLNEADCPDEQISLPAGNERAPKSQA